MGCMKPEELVGKVVYDVARNVIGRVAKAHEKSAYVSPANGLSVDAPVIEFEGGESFIATPDALAAWTVIDEPKAEAFYRDVSKAMQVLTKAMCAAAASSGLSPQLTFLIVGRLLQVQGGALLKLSTHEKESWT